MASKEKIQPCVIVHGGAFNVPEPYKLRYRNGTQAAAKAGYKCLIEGGTALDAAEQAVRAMEDNPIFNAGHGSVLTEIGSVEMDSIVVDVESGKTGAVACVRDVANPVSLARKVMEETPHCLLVSEGAMKFAKKINFPLVENPQEMITNESACKSFQFGHGTFNAHIEAYMNKIVMAKDIGDLEKAFKQSLEGEGEINTENGHDTVGAIAIDKEGRLASATSTGGMPGKMLGRVGDSPLYGCGAYGNQFGACSSTGHGESLIKSNICRQAVYYLEQGCDVMEACQKTTEYLLKETGGRGGIIMIDKAGNPGYSFNTGTMAWALMSSKGIRHGLHHGEDMSS